MVLLVWAAVAFPTNDWIAVAGQELEDNGEAALIRRDPPPPASNAYYRVPRKYV